MKNLFCIVSFFFFTGLSFAQSLNDTLQIRLENILKQYQIPGAMISIVQKDSILFAGGVGYANLDQKEKVGGTHLFRQGSISKTFTALGVLKLVEENKLKLDQPITDIDPSLKIKNKWKANAPITIEQVLEHSAGFDDVHKNAAYNLSISEAPSCLSLINVHRHSLYARWQPGERMAYANPGYVVAGHVIEHLSQKPYSTFIKEEILGPLGMEQSAFYFNKNEEEGFAQGYKRLGGKIIPVEFRPVQGGPASDLCSNANDMALFLRFMLTQKTIDDVTVLNERLLNRMQKSKTTIAAKNGHELGYGLGITSMWSNNHLFYGHDGGIDGFSSLYLYSKDANFGVAVCLNSESDPWHLIKEILGFYLGANEYSDSSTVEIPKATKTQYEGFYNFKNPRNQSFYFIQKMFDGNSLSFMDNKMIVKDFRDNILDTLYHKGKNQFYRKDEGIPFVTLFKKKEQPILWLGNHYAEKGSKPIRKLLNFGLFGIIAFSFLYFFVGAFLLGKDLWSKDGVKNKENVHLWFTALSLVLFVVSFIVNDEFYQSNESINLGSILLFIFSVGFLLFALYSFVKSFKLRTVGKVLRWYQRVTAFSLFALAIYCLYNGLISFDVL